MINILIVEDDERILQFCADNLRKIGPHINPILASTAEDAMILLTQYSIDGAFIDIILPGMDGFSLASRIRDMENYYFLPIVFETGENKNVPDTYKEYRNIDYISKPFTPEAFLSSAARLIIDVEKQRKISLKKDENKITFQYDGGRALIAFSEVLYATTEPSRRIRLVTRTNDFYRSNITLSNIITEINSEMFIQCHKAYIVNISNIKRIEQSFSRKAWTIYFQNAPDKTCQMGKKYKRAVEELLYRDRMVNEDSKPQ